MVYPNEGEWWGVYADGNYDTVSGVDWYQLQTNVAVEPLPSRKSHLCNSLSLRYDVSVRNADSTTMTWRAVFGNFFLCVVTANNHNP